MLKRFSLLAKVTLLLSVVVFGVVIALTYFMAQSAKSVIESDYRKRSNSVADLLADKLDDHPQLPPKTDLEDLVFAAGEKNLSITEISIFMYDGKNTTLAATSINEENSAVPNEVREIILGDKRIDRVVFDGKERFCQIGVPIVYHSPKGKLVQRKVLGCVIVYTSLEQADQIIAKNFRVAFLFAPPAILLLILLLNILFRFTIHKPVKTIQEAMAKAEAGDLMADVNLNSSDELGRIAASYNRMLHQIREVTKERLELIEKVGNFNIELKSEVAIATAELKKRNQELRDLNSRLLKMQLELVQLERLAVAGQLTATFAHEVGTPLNLISGHVQLLIESFSDNEIILRKLTLVQSQIRRLSEIVRRLLDATRRPKIELALVNLNELIQNVGALIKPTLQTDKIQYLESLQPELPLIHADQKQLEQVLLNFINNSLDAMPNGGELRIETETGPENKVHIRVIDTGTGILPEHLEKLFQPMFTTKEIGQGTGLGLSICQDIIKEHGGEIEVKAVPGGGATFTILLSAEIPVLQS
jgi:signal transduction histidine kinase